MEQRVVTEFEVFGFAVLRKFFTPDEVSALTAEVATALAAVYGDLHMTNTRPDAGADVAAPGSFLPLMANAAPFSQQLTTDDDRIAAASTTLLGDCVLAGPALATCLSGDTPWHNDPGSGSRWVRMNAYLTPTTASTGALRVVPGSHHGDAPATIAAALGQLWRRDRSDALPAVALETAPGDLVVFDPRIHHGSWGGGPRLRWSLDFVAMPALDDRQAVADARGLIEDLSDWPTTDAWPTWSDWMTGSTAGRRAAVEKLTAIGVL